MQLPEDMMVRYRSLVPADNARIHKSICFRLCMRLDLIVCQRMFQGIFVTCGVLSASRYRLSDWTVFCTCNTMISSSSTANPK